MKRIKLTQGKFALVDDEDYEFLSQWKWRTSKRPRNFYAIRDQWDPVQKKQIRIHMHRLLLNPPDGFETDHRDGNGLNNQRYNLRVSTHQQNCQNQSIVRNKKSKFKGVTFTKNAYEARIFSSKVVYLGRFQDEVEAAKAYDQAASQLFGDHARLNFPNV